MQVQTRGEFGGLGIEVTQEGGYIKVISPIDDTPAARAGVKPGDLITHLNGNSVQGLTLQEAVEQMRGERGTAISITIRREGADRPIELSPDARRDPPAGGRASAWKATTSAISA